jgi:hypothetical protein
MEEGRGAASPPSASERRGTDDDDDDDDDDDAAAAADDLYVKEGSVLREGRMGTSPTINDITV